MPHPNKIQKMIDNYIKNKIIPKENILLRTLITIGVALGIFITATILLYLAVIYL